VTAMKLDSVMTSGAITSTDLDSSSNYSNEIEFLYFVWHSINYLTFREGRALKVVAGEVSLCVALRQGLVGPYGLAKASYWSFWTFMTDQKGNRANIPGLRF